MLVEGLLLAGFFSPKAISVKQISKIGFKKSGLFERGGFPNFIQLI